MKVLFINSVCNGSTGNIIQKLYNEFSNRNDECVIAYGRGVAVRDFNTYKIGCNFSVKFHGLMSRLFDSQGLYSKIATKKFIKYIQTYKPDLIWIHNIHGYYLNYKILFSYLASTSIKVNWTMHDCWSFTGHCAYFDYAKCEKWKTECKHCPSKGDYPACILFSNAKRNFRIKKKIFNLLPTQQLTIICPSKWLANLIKQYSFLSKYSIKVVNNKIDNDVFKPTPSNIKEKYKIENKKVILGVASVWDRRKGLEDFIELSKIISDEYKIVLIGLNNNQVKKLPKNMLGITRTENKRELAEWYSASDIFFDPTYEDNYPTVLLEAKSCGCTTVSYNTGGCIEIAEIIINTVYDMPNILRSRK